MSQGSWFPWLQHCNPALPESHDQYTCCWFNHMMQFYEWRNNRKYCVYIMWPNHLLRTLREVYLSPKVQWNEMCQKCPHFRVRHVQKHVPIREVRVLFQRVVCTLERGPHFREWYKQAPLNLKSREREQRIKQLLPSRYPIHTTTPPPVFSKHVYLHPHTFTLNLTIFEAPLFACSCHI